MRIGIFGGTFNPVHKGHVIAAEAIYKAFELDTCIWVPSNLPPHKDEEGLENALHRLKMVELATQPYRYYDVSDVEIQRKGPSYTLDTINYFSEKNLKAKLFLLLGTDAFLLMRSWKNPIQILEKVNVIIMYRPGKGTWEEQIRQIGLYIRTNLDKEYRYSEENECFSHLFLKTIYLKKIPALDVSSTEIREKLARDENVDQWINPDILQYIQAYHLFKVTK